LPLYSETVLVDDHPLIREGIRSLLATARDIQVVGEAADGRAALRQMAPAAPDIVLIDVNMPHLDGLATTAVIVKKWPQVRVLVLTVHNFGEYVVEIVYCGAHGYVSKDAPPAELLRALRTVARGGTHFEPASVMQYLRRYQPATLSAGRRGKALTGREQEVLALVASGLSNREIATRLGIGVRTVETHRERLMRTLDIHTVAGLTRYALAHDVGAGNKSDG